MKKANAPPGSCFMVNGETSSHDELGAGGCPAGSGQGSVKGQPILTRNWQREEHRGIRAVASGVPAPPVKLVYCKTLSLRNKTFCEKEFGDGASVQDTAFPSRVAAGIRLSCPGQLKG